MKFRLLRGTHEQQGKTYQQGSVVETDVDLVKLFGSNKFQKVRGGNKPSRTTTTTTTSPTTTTAPVEDDGEDNPPSSDETNTSTTTTTEAQTPPVDDEPPVSNEDDSSGDDGAALPDETKFGSNKTTDFDIAVENGLGVYAKNGWYVVVEAEDPEKALHERAMRPSDVTAWITDYLEDEE